MPVAGGPDMITDGLVLCLDASDKNSYPGTGTTWLDVSGNGNNGTLTNGPTFNSENGGTIFFDGSNDYAPIGTTGLPIGTSAGTLYAWAKTNTISGGYSWIISYGNPNCNQSRFLGINGSTYYFGGYSDDVIVSGVPLSTWFNMVGVWNGTQASLYLNGILIAGPTSKSWSTISNNAQLGRQTNGSEYWNGNIAQVSVYNRALTALEVLQNYNATKSRFLL